jgi:hypothetical protein
MKNDDLILKDIGSQAEKHLSGLNEEYTIPSPQSPTTQETRDQAKIHPSTSESKAIVLFSQPPAPIDKIPSFPSPPSFWAKVLGYDIYKNKFRFFIYLISIGGLFFFWAYPRWCLARQEYWKDWRAKIEDDRSILMDHFN